MPFEEGDWVKHLGEEVMGEVVDVDYTPPYFKVKWEDGEEALATLHSVVKVDHD